MNKETPDEVLKEVEEEGNYWSTYAPACPYCGHFDDDFGDGIQYNTNLETYFCGNCCKEYDIEVQVSYSWETRRK